MNLFGLPEDETRAFLKEATAAAAEVRESAQRFNRLLDRFESAATSAAAGWQVPPSAKASPR
jgi:hypothetical protein